jgi:YaiO family outer membrane protein
MMPPRLLQSATAAGFACLLGIVAAGRPPGLDEALAAKVGGRHAEAESRLRDLAQIHPADREVRLQLGTVQGWLGRHEEALATFEAGLVAWPGDPELRLGRGRILAWMGRLDEAEAVFRGLEAENPGSREVRNMLGRVLAWKRRFDAADAVYAEILAQAPRDTDALVGRGDIQRMQGQLSAARALYEAALAVEPESADIAQRLEGIRRAGAWRLDVGLDFSGFDDPARPDWRGAYAALRRALGPRSGVGAQAEWAERYGARDTQYFLTVDHRFSDAWAATLRLGATPDAAFLARRQLDAGVVWQFREGSPRWPTTELLVDARVADYGPATARSAWIGIAQRLPQRLILTAKGLVSRNLNGRSTGGWQIRLAGEPRESWRWFVGYADSEESFTPSLFELSRDLRTRALFGGVQHDLNPLQSIRADALIERVESGATRRGIHVGFTQRF